MSYSEEVKQLAYKLDEECWVSYTGKKPDHKRAMDKRRSLSLESAEHYIRDRELMKAVHSLEETVKEVIAPKKYKLHGRELETGDTLVTTDLPRTELMVVRSTETHLRLTVPGYAVTFAVPWAAVEKNFSWPKEAKSEQEELRRYYDTVITDMCKGTAIKPWECVRYVKDKERVATVGSPQFTRPKEDYEFALTVHLDRPVWVGSVLYVGEQDRGDDVGSAWEVLGLTEEGHLTVVPRGQKGGAVNAIAWRDWAVWEKPVKQKAPTRVTLRKAGYQGWVTVPEQITGKGTARLVLDFGSNKDAAEFYEVFKNLTGEKKAQR